MRRGCARSSTCCELISDKTGITGPSTSSASSLLVQPANQPARLLVESARAAGARFLLYGGIQKMSTLIQHSKVQVVDLQTNKLVFDRLISFRGDTDESWQRAERFLVRELRSVNLLSQ